MYIYHLDFCKVIDYFEIIYFANGTRIGLVRFMAYQPLLFIQCPILFIIYMLKVQYS